MSLVTPIYKTGDKTKFTNYRPISVLPCFGKILEKIMFKRLTSYITKHETRVGNFPDCQFISDCRNYKLSVIKNGTLSNARLFPLQFRSFKRSVTLCHSKQAHVAGFAC
jgi:hypothetical protein